MEIIQLPKAEEDLSFWIKTGNKPILKKIANLTEAILLNNFSGIGKPEPLKYHLSGKWSRRISDEHRYIYEIDGNNLIIFSLKGHYE